MSGEDEGFLNRWSRRKQEAVKEAQENPVEKPKEETAAPLETEAAATEEEFDVSTLPPIESITAGTDIRAFLSKGVPAALTQAALRRAWSADPAIRDHIGLSEYSWDFNSPGQYGFGQLDPSINIQEMVADAFGKVKEAISKVETAAEESGSSPPQATADTAASEPPRSVELRVASNESANAPSASENSESERGDKNAQENAAPQQVENTESAIPFQPRRHGSALPS